MREIDKEFIKKLEETYSFEIGHALFRETYPRDEWDILLAHDHSEIRSLARIAIDMEYLINRIKEKWNEEER